MRISKNKFIHVGDDGVVTGLVSADTLMEAQEDADSLGLQGKIETMQAFFDSPKGKEEVLSTRRNAKMLRILRKTAMADEAEAIKYVDEQYLTGRGKKLARLLRKRRARIDQVAAMSEAELDNYDPDTDSELNE